MTLKELMDVCHSACLDITINHGGKKSVEPDEELDERVSVYGDCTRVCIFLEMKDSDMCFKVAEEYGGSTVNSIGVCDLDENTISASVTQTTD